MKHALLLAVLIATSIASAGVDLVKDGNPTAEIVIAAKPARMTRLAATELQIHIEKMTGARLPIVSKPSGGVNPVYVGVSSFTEKLGLKTDDLEHGASRMDSGTDWVAFLGPDKDFEPVEPYPRQRSRSQVAHANAEWDKITGETYLHPFPSLGSNHYFGHLDVWDYDDRGTINAVHQFLRELGVRWYFPGEIGAIIPTRETISFPENKARIEKPAYAVRDISWWHQRFFDKDDQLWRLRLGLRPGRAVIGAAQRCHGMKFVHGREEVREAHPEYFALIGGERVTDMKRVGAPCLSSEELFNHHVNFVRQVFDHFDEPMISIDLVDGYSCQACRCSLCADKHTPERGAIGAISDYVWPYVNRVAKEIYKSHPHKMVSALSYGAYTLPPKTVERMSPNVVLFLMSPRQVFHRPEHREYFTKLIEDWRKILPSNEFYTFENLPYNRSPLPAFFTTQTVDFLDAVGDTFTGHHYSASGGSPAKRAEQGWHDLAIGHLDAYLLSRLWWDRDTDVEATVDEYCRLFYGPAAEEMRAFIAYCAENHPRMRNDVAVIDHALELLAAGQEAAAADSVYGRRVALVADEVARLAQWREKLTQPREGPDIVLERRSAQDIEVDGRLNDAFWKDLPAIRLKERREGGEAALETRVKMAWADNDSLYIAVYCEEPDMAGIRETHDGTLGIFNGDTIDILVETPIADFYQVTVSPAGNVLDMDRSNTGRLRFNMAWNSGLTVATRQGEDFWTMELQLPAGGENARVLDANHLIAGDPPRQDAPWYFNLGRNRPRSEKTDFDVYVPTGEHHFHNRFIRGRLAVE